MEILIEKSKTASFDVDCQNSFTPLCPDELPVPDGHNIVDALNKQTNYADYRIGSKDCHNRNAIWVATEDHPQFEPVEGENVDIRWKIHCEVGTYGYELLDGLPKVTDYDYFVFKGIENDLHPYSAVWHDLKKKLSTGVAEFLRHKQVENVIVGGLAIDYCVFQTCMDLSKCGFNVILNIEASRGITEDTINSAIETMKERGITIIENTDCLRLVKPDYSKG